MKKIVTLVLAVLMIATLIVPAAAKVEKNELLFTIDVNTGARYETNYHTVLTRVGDRKTIAEVVDYIANREGKNTDYNWFYVYAAVLDDDGNYVITESWLTLGRDDPAGPKAEVEIPENGILVCVNAGDGDHEEFTTSIKNTVKVGDLVVLENVDVNELKTLEPGDNSLDGVGKVHFYTAKEVADDDNSTGDDSSAPADDSKPADESKPADKNPETGDATMVFALIALVTVAGAVVVARKRVR